MAIHVLTGLLLRTIEITLKSVVECLVGCLVSEILKDKDMTKRLAERHRGYSNNPWRHKQGKIRFLKEHVGKMYKVKVSWICMYILLTKVEKFSENFMAI